MVRKRGIWRAERGQSRVLGTAAAADGEGRARRVCRCGSGVRFRRGRSCGSSIVCGSCAFRAAAAPASKRSIRRRASVFGGPCLDEMSRRRRFRSSIGGRGLCLWLWSLGTKCSLRGVCHVGHALRSAADAFFSAAQQRLLFGGGGRHRWAVVAAVRRRVEAKRSRPRPRPSVALRGQCLRRRTSAAQSVSAVSESQRRIISADGARSDGIGWRWHHERMDDTASPAGSAAKKKRKRGDGDDERGICCAAGDASRLPCGSIAVPGHNRRQLCSADDGPAFGEALRRRSLQMRRDVRTTCPSVDSMPRVVRNML